jgi:integrase
VIGGAGRIVRDPPRHRSPERQPFTAEEARALLASTDGGRLAALYWLALALGLRRGELLGLRWQDLDLDAATLRVARSLQRTGGAIVLKESHAVAAATGHPWSAPPTWPF